MVPVSGIVLNKEPLAENEGAAEKPRVPRLVASPPTALPVCEHDSITGAEDSFRVDLKRHTDAGSEILEVVVYWRGAVTRAGSMTGELQSSILLR